ncbi:zinc-dependent alcohol dehydrogenase family protein [Goodfellowiella coeruleoviolacea]|uniref:NADPH:quinone reductase n=1 Tax=Goodfellowiella coeruleoviolacea TaxID=334858 RepID=A0AAE3GFB1_9PSEU|nr:zinc-dependent alcohol dehydrogenase family protein [Goodfellowiella coeruleoviolacea]MCP2166274.1 NADPH:quinone reductase [Goodfellowiella coeruleoviolacea]
MTRTVLFDEVGGPEVLRVVDVPVADPGPGEVLVRVEAIGLNRAEALFRSGGYYYPATLPNSRLGSEAAGVVEAVGPGVTDHRPGDTVSVLAVSGSMSDRGVYAERIVVSANDLLHRPAEVDAVTGAAVWLSYLTAYGALVEVGRMAPGDHVLITAASSAAGVAAIQMANHVGAVPIAVTRTDAKRDRLLAAGAAHVLTTAEGDLPERVRELTDGQGARLVFDPVAGPGLAELATTVARGGMLIVYGWLDTRPAPLPLNWPLHIVGYGLNLLLEDEGQRRRGEAFINAGLRAGTLAPIVDRTFDLVDIVEAHRYLEANNQLGKIVVTVQH